MTGAQTGAAAIALLMTVQACNEFAPDDRYRCAGSGDCIEGFSCIQSVCVPSITGSRLLYSTGGSTNAMVLRSPEGSGEPIDVTGALDTLGFPTTPDAGGLSHGGTFLAFRTTAAVSGCQDWACLALAAGDLSKAMIVQQLASPGTFHPDEEPMDVSEDGTRIAYVEDSAIYVTRLLSGAPLDAPTWSEATKISDNDPGADQGCGWPAFLPYGARDRAVFSCGPMSTGPYGYTIYQVVITDDILASDDANPTAFDPEVMPGYTDGETWLVSPRYARIGDETRIVFASNAGGGANVWHLALDGSDPQRVTSWTDDDPEIQELCVFADRRVATMAADDEQSSLRWLSLDGIAPQPPLFVTPIEDPYPRLLGCN